MLWDIYDTYICYITGSKYIDSCHYNNLYTCIGMVVPIPDQLPASFDLINARTLRFHDSLVTFWNVKPDNSNDRSVYMLSKIIVVSNWFYLNHWNISFWNVYAINVDHQVQSSVTQWICFRHAESFYLVYCKLCTPHTGSLQSNLKHY